MTFAWWTIDEGAEVPEHSHPHEQVVNMLDGTLALTVAGAEHVLHPGDVVAIPARRPPRRPRAHALPRARRLQPGPRRLPLRLTSAPDDGLGPGPITVLRVSPPLGFCVNHLTRSNFLETGAASKIKIGVFGR